jgi:hypothetical protein
MVGCKECRFFVAAPGDLERAIPGLNILSSGFGSVRADTGLCAAQDIFVVPIPACADFEPAASFKPARNRPK